MINAALPENVLKDIVQQMCDLQKHGGPDDGGLYSSATDSLVLGNRRLALLDLSAAGHQPMQSYDGRYQIVYNGELYNFKELRDELKAKGYNFSTKTDTEVIIKAYQAWGTNSFNRFSASVPLSIAPD